MKWWTVNVNNIHGMPWGIMNEIESAKAPHSALFVWNTMIQAVSPAIHTAAPIADITTSKI